LAWYFVTRMSTCTLCETHTLETPDEEKMQACATCAAKLGLVPMREPRRPPVPCMRCNGLKFLRAIPREHSSSRSGEINAQVSVPMMLTHPPAVHKGWVFKHAKELEIESGYGQFEVYTCFQCGFVEWYCHDVSSIPVHPHLMTDVVDYAPESPYR